MAKKDIKRRVLFLLPVTVTADSEEAFNEALREFRQDPVYSSGCFGEHGWYKWEMGTPRRKPKATT